MNAPDCNATVPGDVLQHRRWLALAATSTASLMVVFDTSVVSIAPYRRGTTHAWLPANRQWVITAYALAFGGLLLLDGRFVDFVGRE